MSLPDLATTGRLIWKDFTNKTKWWEFDASVQDPGCHFEFGGPMGTGAATKRYNFPNTPTPCFLCVNNSNNNFTQPQTMAGATVNGTLQVNGDTTTTGITTVNTLQFSNTSYSTDQYYDYTAEIKFDGVVGTPAITVRQFRIGNQVTLMMQPFSDAPTNPGDYFKGAAPIQGPFIPGQDVLVSAGGGIDDNLPVPLVCLIDTGGNLNIWNTKKGGMFNGPGTVGWTDYISFTYLINF
jgi:hypothetical protein